MIGVTRDGNVLTLEMQRAERRNALNGALVDGLREEIEKASGSDVRAIVLTGQGTVFSAGADLSDAEGVAKELPDKALALNLAIDASPVPIIAALNGPAIGAGVILAMVCDLRVAAPSTYFQFPIAKYGLALDNWSIRRLTSLVGHGRARGMLIAAERLDLDTALLTGMVNRTGTLADAQTWAARSPVTRPCRSHIPSGCSTTTVPMTPSAATTPGCSTRRGPARMSSKRRWRASRSGRRTSRGPEQR